MKLSFRAFCEWVDFQGTAVDLANVLSELGFPNDGITHLGEGLDQVVVGKILTKNKHPQADRLSLLQVNVGSETLPIVCGAQNMVAGDWVALAPVGAKIPGKDRSGLTMKEAKIRGETSKGMCCSEAELCLSEESDGIILLSKEGKDEAATLGKRVSDIYALEDWVLEIDVTPNRGDALSIRGLAREVAAKLGLKFKTQATYKWKNPTGAAHPSIESFSDASGFAACLVQGVSDGKSPASWVRFLNRMGARSISQLVDITNIVMFELGHPLHFFDADKIDPLSIGVRRAKAGEKLELLNGATIELHPEDLVIADSSGPLSLAGVMGGARTSVSEKTKNILIEVASFNPSLIRASSRRHGISSESSYRFERGITPYRFDEVIERVLGLLKEVSPFETAAGTKIWDRQLQPKQVLWDRKRVESKLGALSQTDDELFELLRRLEYGFAPKGSTTSVTFPWYRTDVGHLEDVMEDIARLLGYENLQKTLLRSVESVKVLRDLSPAVRFGDQIIDRFTNVGFSECIHLSFSHKANEEKFLANSGLKSVELENPIHAEKSHLRRYLLPQLIERAQFNLHHGEDRVQLVELGPVYGWGKNSAYENSPASERFSVACVWATKPADEKRLWENKADAFYNFKGMLSQVWGAFDVDEVSYDSLSDVLHPSRRMTFKHGIAGELHPALLKAFDLPYRCFVGEWFVQGKAHRPRYSTPPVYPAIDLDVCFVVSKELSVEAVSKAIHQVKNPLLESVSVYDLFESKTLGENKKSMTFAVRYRSQERTLTLDEAKASHDQLTASVLKAFTPGQVALR